MSAPAKVLLDGVRLASDRRFYRPGTKRYDRLMSGQRALAAAIIAIGC